MSSGPAVRPEATGDTKLARARERFLSAEPIEPGQVRDTILASWRRSQAWNGPAAHIDLSYVREPDLAPPLSRNALPILRDLRDNLEGQPISVVLTDARGVLLTRLTADRDLERHLDGVQILPGFCYAEQFVGTNGIGTALESGQAAHVFGHEHYAEHLEDLACAAAPVRHPLSGKIVAVVDLTCWRKDADALLIALAESTAGQIAQALLNDASGWEVQLLQEYLRACRHSAGIVFALNEDMVMMSHHARDVLDPGDQAAVLGRAAEALAGGQLGPVDVELPSGARARMSCRPVRGQGQRDLAGGVAHAKLIKPAPDGGAQPRGFLPGLVGSGPLWVAVTLSNSPVKPALASVLQFFPSTVELPPLRHHIEDMHQLVPFFLAKLSHDGRLTCSPGAMQLLLRFSWPGNTEQLWQVLRRVVRRKRSGTIEPDDLPPECWTVSRRLLSPLESMERDAIVQALLDLGGNKVKTAESLGMSRATIYRKIHEYGIVTPSS